MPEVSVIMPVYNGERFLAEAIESVLSQSFEDLELICVDDGSIDESKDIIHSFHDERIKYLYQKNSGSPARGRNVGINESKGNYIAFIDQDDLYMPESIYERVNCFINDPKINFVYSDCEIIDVEGNRISDSIITHANKIPYSGKCFKKLFLGNFIPIQGVMVNRKVFDSVGLFNEHLVGTDDYEMLLRISYHYPVVYVDKTLARWRSHQLSLSHNQHQMDENVANCLDSVLRHLPDCYTLVGENVKERMYALSKDVAYGYLLRGECNSARQWLKKTWYWGRKPKTLLTLAAVTCCWPLMAKYYGRQRGQG